MIHISDVNLLPDVPGIYRFLLHNKPIYIGKSINIKVRIRSHIKAGKYVSKEKAIVTLADSVDYIQTQNDFDAIILEAKLIKKYKPKYNSILKDDKHFLYIKISQKEKYPKVSAVRAENDKKSLYFGPFTSSKSTETLIYNLRRVVPFCTQKKIGSRPCFYSKIGLCNPCPSYIEAQKGEVKVNLHKQYISQIKILKKLLNGERTDLNTLLLNKMNNQSNNKQFEDAIITRNTIETLHSMLLSSTFSTYDFFEYDKQELITNEFKEFMNTVYNTQITDDSFRIECFDISTLFGSNSTGSMVVFENGSLTYNKYRRFKIKKSNTADFDRMQEMLLRRFSHKEWNSPDLIIVDGGKPQVTAVITILNDMVLTIPVLGLAKKPDRLVYPNNINYHKLKNSSRLFKLFQQLRDESHRFAKKYHITLRHKDLMI